MNRFKFLLLACLLTLSACKATAPAAPKAPQRLGAVVPLGSNVYPRGFYNSSPPTATNGDSVNLQSDVNGNLKVAGTISATVDNSALTQPTTSAAVTPSDSTVLACGKGLWVGTGGNLSLKLSGDSAAVTWLNVASGSYTAGSVIRVMVATTAANIVCLN